MSYWRCQGGRGVERTEVKLGIEPGAHDDPITYQTITFIELLPCAAAPPPKSNPERTLNEDCTATARTPGPHGPIKFVTHLRAMQMRLARKGGGKRRV